MEDTILGIDIGGSGIKAAPVAIATGELVAERVRVETPAGAEPDAVVAVVSGICRQFSWTGPVGIAFPAVITTGLVRTAANISKKWIGLDAARLFGQATGTACSVINDADAAGMALLRYTDEARECPGVVLVLTIGTGIGTALFTGGRLVPNLELGHIEVGGIDAETWASDGVRKKEDLSWEKWAKRFNAVLEKLEDLLWPELIVIGGGAARKIDRFGHLLKTRARLIPAPIGNSAGIIGAALAGHALRRG